LAVQCHARTVLVGGTEDQLIAQQITGTLPWPDVEDWTGMLKTSELAALLERADAFVGADSGPAHLAAAVGAPTVVLFSGTNNAEQWRPWGPNVAVVRHEVPCSPCHRQECPLAGHPCMAGVRPEQVMEEVVRLMQCTSRTPGRQERGRLDVAHPAGLPCLLDKTTGTYA
jgi:ADP-heptose:LPS heptosyltransferase